MIQVLIGHVTIGGGLDPLYLLSGMAGGSHYYYYCV